MDLYLFTLVVGFGGLVLMALLGLSTGGHHARAATGGHSLHGAAPLKLGGKSLPHARSGSARGVREGRGAGALLGLLSPRVLFSLLLGFGAAGMILRPLIPLPFLLLALSTAAAVIFERGIIQPLWNFLLNFASQPAKMLDQLLLEEAKAASDFDRSGHGLVSVELDGQARQILATLCREELATGTRVRTGDRLFIRNIDGARNTCTVSLLPC
jgi:hypothetical protein